MNKTAALLLTLGALSCTAPDPIEHGPVGSDAILEALSFHASFDDGLDADHARGDGTLYSAASYDELDTATPGLGTPEIQLVADGVRGGSLRFHSKNTRAVYYRAPRNVRGGGSRLRGTICFWLSLDPDQDLEPGFCDPIQLTDDTYDDSAIWVDFTKDDTPRHFRLGVFGDRSAWNPEGTPTGQNPVFEQRLVVEPRPPFRADRWTLVSIVVDGLGEGGGRASLYLDGERVAESPPIAEAFTWDLERTTIRLGINYVGRFDELSIYDRPLSVTEIRLLRDHVGLPHLKSRRER